MMDGYDSFLIRRWRGDGTALRISVEHIQSGRRAAFASLAAALAWMETCSQGAADGQSTANEEEERTSDARPPGDAG